MNKQYTFHLLRKVEPLNNLVLRAHFTSGEVKDYNLEPLTSKLKPFSRLKNEPGLFEKAHVHGTGYAVQWDDALDLSSEDIWHDGVAVRQGGAVRDCI